MHPWRRRPHWPPPEGSDMSTPADKHSAAKESLLARLEGKTVVIPGVTGPAPQPRAEALSPPEATAPAEADAEAGSGDGGEAPDAASSPPASDGARAERPASRLQRAVELQRRADEARTRSRREAQKIRERDQASEDRAREAESRAKRAANLERGVREREGALQRDIDLIRTNPIEFARRHGLTQADLVAVGRGERSPAEARVELALERFRKENDRQLSEIRDAQKRLESAREEESLSAARSAFLAHVTGDEKRFEALNTIYSPEELVAKADALAEKNEKLRWGWDGDRLCEELEARARKDPRWTRIQSRFEPRRAATGQPNAPAAKTPNAPRSGREAAPSEEVEEDEPVAPPPRPRAPARPSMTPQERHRRHVDRLAGRVGRIG